MSTNKDVIAMMKHFNVTEEELDQMRKEYDAGDFSAFNGAELKEGSPVHYLGTKRESFVVQGSELAAIERAAKKENITKSQLYRKAVAQYLGLL